MTFRLLIVALLTIGGLGRSHAAHPQERSVSPLPQAHAHNDVVVSGNRPLATMQAQTERFAGVDGRLSDLDSDLPPHLMPLLSDRWGAHFRWRGIGPIDEAEHRKLTEFVNRAYAAGRRLRFWATPETQKCWQLLHDASVDHIKTDQLAELQQFLTRP